MRGGGVWGGGGGQLPSAEVRPLSALRGKCERKFGGERVPGRGGGRAESFQEGVSWTGPAPASGAGKESYRMPNAAGTAASELAPSLAPAPSPSAPNPE